MNMAFAYIFMALISMYVIFVIVRAWESESRIVIIQGDVVIAIMIASYFISMLPAIR